MSYARQRPGCSEYPCSERTFDVSADEREIRDLLREAGRFGRVFDQPAPSCARLCAVVWLRRRRDPACRGRLDRLARSSIHGGARSGARASVVESSLDGADLPTGRRRSDDVRQATAELSQAVRLESRGPAPAPRSLSQRGGRATTLCPALADRPPPGLRGTSHHAKRPRRRPFSRSRRRGSRSREGSRGEPRAPCWPISARPRVAPNGPRSSYPFTHPQFRSFPRSGVRPSPTLCERTPTSSAALVFEPFSSGICSGCHARSGREASPSASSTRP